MEWIKWQIRFGSKPTAPLTTGANTLDQSQRTHSMIFGAMQSPWSNTQSTILSMYFQCFYFILYNFPILSDIKDIQDDMLQMYTYLNTSYHENHFYVKDIVGLAILLIDEFSLK